MSRRTQILVVDDEPQLLNVTSRLLLSAGRGAQRFTWAERARFLGKTVE